MTCKKILFSLALCLSCLSALTVKSQKAKKVNVDINWGNHQALVYTKNGKGYVHENIPFAVKCVEKLGQQYGFKTDVSDSPTVFTEENLKRYSILIFTSTNNDVFDTDEQRLAFRRYMEAGGGFVGIHSVVGTERNWTWFKMMLGGTFAWHPKFQKYRLQVIESDHPSVAGLPKVWEKEDECYFQKEIYPGIHTVMAHDINTLDESEKEKINASAGPFTKYYPAVWYQQFDGGTIWITALGHDKKDYEDPTYVQHIFQGIKFVASQVRPKQYPKAYAKSKDQPVQY
jgi:type 1 glutamine amidotransferase